MTANEPTPSNPNMSSVQGGIFGAPVAPAPDTRSAVTKSGIAGGIFGTDAPTAPNTGTGVTKSSVEGGIFGHHQHVEPSVSHAFVPKVPVEDLGAAGNPVAKSDSVSLTWGESDMPLQPLPSARSNPNASSIAGGIFGSAPMATKPAVARQNPNASSIQGGIFG